MVLPNNGLLLLGELYGTSNLQNFIPLFHSSRINSFSKREL
jgi:hypothetical protein